MDGSNRETSEGNGPKDLWLNGDRIAKELKEKHAPVNYPHIVGDNKILFFAELHDNDSIRSHIAAHAHDLKEAGITHYAIEAKEQGNDVFDKLNQGEDVSLEGVDVGPMGGWGGYETAIRAMAAEGIKVVAVDIDQGTEGHIPSKEEREARMTANVNKILEDPNAKVAYLVGSLHTSKKTSMDYPDWIGKRMSDAGVPTVTVGFAGGKTLEPRKLTDGAIDAGLASQEFMLDMHPYADAEDVPFGAGERDYVIHMPRVAQEETDSSTISRLHNLRQKRTRMMEPSRKKSVGVSSEAIAKHVGNIRAQLSNQEKAPSVSEKPTPDTHKRE